MEKPMGILILLLLAVCGCSGAALPEKEALSSPAAFSADEAAEYAYRLLPDGSAEITGFLRVADTIDIPAEIDGYPITSIGDHAFDTCEGIRALRIPDGITHIGAHAFGNCFALKEVELPASVLSLGANPFCNCSSLQIRVAPDNPVLQTVDGVLFCLPENRLVCYPSALSDKSYVVPEGIRIIDSLAFYNCGALTSISIPDGVAAIGELAFFCCSNLRSVTLPDSLVSIGENPFAICGMLSDIRFSGSRPVLEIDNGVLFCRSEDRLVCYLPGNGSESYSVPEGTQNIDCYAFSCCTSLKHLDIPTSVTRIGESAFFGSALESFAFSDGVTVIESYAFSCCDSLQSVTLPGSLSCISDGMFESCSSLQSVTIPEGTASIGAHAFSYCRALTSVSIPNTVTRIGEKAFTECSELTLCVTPGSFAEQYAKDNGIPYVYTG